MSRLKDIKQSGFTLLEIMIAVAIIGISAALAYPSIINMVHEYRLRSMTRGLFSDLQEIKLLAIKEHVRTVIFVDEANDTYTLFRDNNEDWILDAGELIRTVSVKTEGLEITCNRADKVMGFNSRGRAAERKFGTITIHLGATRKKEVILQLVNIRVK